MGFFRICLAFYLILQALSVCSLGGETAAQATVSVNTDESVEASMSHIEKDSLSINNEKGTDLVFDTEDIAMNCNLPGKILSSVHHVPLEDCYNICKGTEGCTHFTWANSNGGMCLMKQDGASKSQAFHETDLVCGIMDKDETFSASFGELENNLTENLISRSISD